MEGNGFEINDENDDPVEREIPIYVAKCLQDNSYIFQYSLERKCMEMSKGIRRAFVKPNNMEVRLEMDINTESPSFDPVKAKDIAAEVDGVSDKRDDGNIMFENEMVDKIVFTSNKLVNNPKKYAIGHYNGRELHLRTVKGILQFRPPFSYVNKYKKNKEKKIIESTEEAGSPSLQKVRVKFGRKAKLHSR